MKTTQFAASVAPVIFSSETCQQLEGLARASNDIREFVIGCLVFVATAASHPEFLPVEKRLATFRGNCSAAVDDDSTRRLWSDAGFFLAPSTTPDNTGNLAKSAVCFHCGIRCCFQASRDSQVDLVQMHQRSSLGCELARLLNFATGRPKSVGLASSEEVSSSAAKLRRAIAKLLSDLSSSRVLDHVESYGLPRWQAAFCACRQFMRSRDGRATARPGDLIQMMHDSESLLEGLPAQLDVEAAMREIGAAATTFHAAAVEEARSLPTGAAESLKVKADQEPAKLTAAAAAAAAVIKSSAAAPAESKATDADDSEKCAVCNLRVRNQVTLPCAHFLLCSQCACERRQCPKCDKPILATVKAYIA